KIAKENQAELDRIAKEREEAKAAARRRRNALLTIGVIALTFFLAGIFFLLPSLAARDHLKSYIDAAAVDSNSTRRLQESLVAFKSNRNDVGAETSLRSALSQWGGRRLLLADTPVTALAVSHDGRRLVTFEAALGTPVRRILVRQISDLSHPVE